MYIIQNSTKSGSDDHKPNFNNCYPFIQQELDSVCIACIKNSKTIDKVPIARKRATQHATKNVLRNKIRIKNEIGTTTNSPISCLNHEILAIFYGMFSYLII